MLYLNLEIQTIDFLDCLTQKTTSFDKNIYEESSHGQSVYRCRLCYIFST